MNITFHLRHESLPKLKGEYQENLATYLYESDDIQVVVLKCLPRKLDWSEIALHLDKQDAPSAQKDQFTGDSLTLPNMLCTEVSYNTITEDDDVEYQYSLYRQNDQDAYIEAEVSLPQDVGLHIGDLCMLTISKA